MKPTTRIAAAVLFALTSGACQSGASSSLTAPVTPSSLNGAASASSLLGATWRLVEVNGQKALAGVSVTAVFAAPNSLSGSGGCNRYFGTAVTDNGKLTVGALGATRMYCAEPGVAAQEDAYFSTLGKATTYGMVGAELRLYPAQGEATLRFERE